MKKVSVVLLLLAVLLLCSCNIKVAKSYESKQIENGYNNFLSGGKMAYFDNNLFLVHNFGNMFTFGAYKINNSGYSEIFDNDDGYDAINNPVFYQYNNELYSLNYGTTKIMKYNEETKSLKESEFDFTVYGYKFYLADDLVVYYSDTDEIGNYYLSVRYKNYNEFILDKKVVDFYVYNNIIYFISSDNWLYSYDVEKSTSKCEFISRLDDGYSSFFRICNGYCYFEKFGSNNSSMEDGIYRFSLDDNSYELVTKKEVVSVNTYNDIFYFVTDDGVYMDNGNECEKISDLIVQEIYILDEDWLYGVDDYNGKVYRISLDRKDVELVL